jgi:hypothetical protein
MCAGSNRPPLIAPVGTPNPTAGTPTVASLVNKAYGNAGNASQGPLDQPMIPPAPSITAMLLGERATPKVGVDTLKLPLIGRQGAA